MKMLLELACNTLELFCFSIQNITLIFLLGKLSEKKFEFWRKRWFFSDGAGTIAEVKIRLEETGPWVWAGSVLKHKLL